MNMNRITQVRDVGLTPKTSCTARSTLSPTIAIAGATWAMRGVIGYEPTGSGEDYEIEDRGGRHWVSVTPPVHR